MQAVDNPVVDVDPVTRIGVTVDVANDDDSMGLLLVTAPVGPLELLFTAAPVVPVVPLPAVATVCPVELLLPAPGDDAAVLFEVLLQLVPNGLHFSIPSGTSRSAPLQALKAKKEIIN